jgi:hypothetical protein
LLRVFAPWISIDMFIDCCVSQSQKSRCYKHKYHQVVKIQCCRAKFGMTRILRNIKIMLASAMSLQQLSLTSMYVQSVASWMINQMIFVKIATMIQTLFLIAVHTIMYQFLISSMLDWVLSLSNQLPGFRFSFICRFEKSWFYMITTFVAIFIGVTPFSRTLPVLLW